MGRRSGGRQARKALRSAPLAEDIKPVHPGELGGRYRPLTDADVAAIDANIYRILDEVGFKDATPHCIEACTAVGARLGNDARLRFPRETVEWVVRALDRNEFKRRQMPPGIKLTQRAFGSGRRMPIAARITYE